jgi:hypothetical protein
VADGLGQPDWEAPWYGPWRDAGQRVLRRRGEGLALHDALNGEGAAPVRFVAQSALPEGEPYERHICATGTCPTRDNLHDFFNGLCWLALPRAKRALNALQAAEIAKAGVAPVRGPVRDAITVFDENGAVLQAPPPVWEALLARDWRRLFVDLRPLWRDARLVVFGHALLEKLALPRKDLTAHVWRAPMSWTSMDELDASLAESFTADRLAAKPFTPLPVLGVPGWWAENQNFSFYDDSLVFRPAGARNKYNSPGVAPHP